MTNREKYIEVFGIEPNTGACSWNSCDTCPIHTAGLGCDDKSEWWGYEWKSPNVAYWNKLPTGFKCSNCETVVAEECDTCPECGKRMLPDNE